MCRHHCADRRAHSHPIPSEKRGTTALGKKEAGNQLPDTTPTAPPGPARTRTSNFHRKGREASAAQAPMKFERQRPGSALLDLYST